jgi:two-component system, NarL family, response regulator DegU
MSKINVIIADDHPIFRLGLVDVIKRSQSLNLLGEAEDGEKALHLIREYKPDVAILDLEMPKLTGLDVCKHLMNEKNNATKLLILTLYKEIDLYKKAVQLGVHGYLLKDNAVEELVIAVETIYNGGEFFTNNLSNQLLNEASYFGLDIKRKEDIDKLTPTEKSVLQLVTEGKTTKEIAQKLFISEKTVKNHRYHISKKLGLDGGQNNLLHFALKKNDHTD